MRRFTPCALVAMRLVSFSAVMRQAETTRRSRGRRAHCQTTAWNLGREEAAAKLGGVAFVQYSAILDGNVCGPAR